MSHLKHIDPETLDVSSAWEINSFADDQTNLQLNHKVATPSITKSTQVLIKVYSCSVNPIDFRMCEGYGAKMFQILRERGKGRYLPSILLNPGQQFPLTLGRDFAGVVVAIGSAVTGFKAGQSVYGFVNLVESGSHADFVVVDQSWIQPKPDFMSFSDAASIPYVALTAWSALRNAGGYVDFKDKNFLVLGASGGVGTFVIQYLKSKGAHVTGTCSQDAFPLLKALGLDNVIDYKDPEHTKLIELHGPYDCILDCAGTNLTGPLDILQYGRRGSGHYITFTSPAALNMKNYGLFFGGLKSGIDLLGSNIGSKYNHGVAIKWGFFTPNGDGWKEVAQLVNDRKIKPIVEQVYKYTELPQAFQRLKKGHLRGKLVIEVTPE